MKRKMLLFAIAALFALLATSTEVRAWFAYRYSGYRAGGAGASAYHYGGYHYGASGGYRYGYVRRW